MSDFQRQLFQKKLLKAERALNLDFSEETDESDHDAPFPPVKTPSRRSKVVKDVEIKTWDQFFEESLVLEESGNKFQLYYTLPGNEKSPLFIFHHGAGSSGLSFALLCQQIKEYLAEDESTKDINPGFLVYDARGHGNTMVNDTDYSRNSFVKDFKIILKRYIEEIDPLFKNVIERKSTLPSTLFPPIILIGHSLGGSVLTEALHQFKTTEYFDKLISLNLLKGLVMFDIVEDTAVESLVHMNKFLASRPPGFNSLKIAIDWHIKTGAVRNRESALISVPYLLKETDDEVFKYQWKSDLRQTEPYWSTWFTGLSQGFVEAPVQSKLLILAGNDNLDKGLMIGQMQGKFQLIVFLESGHFLHEDVPNKTALSLIDFWKRNFKTSDKKIPILWGHMRT